MIVIYLKLYYLLFMLLIYIDEKFLLFISSLEEILVQQMRTSLHEKRAFLVLSLGLFGAGMSLVIQLLYLASIWKSLRHLCQKGYFFSK